VATPVPAYLICGDDDAKIDLWRRRVRARAEEEGGPGALEAFDAHASGPDDLAAALVTLTFGEATRHVLADGVEAWKAGDLEPLERELRAPPPETVLVLIARGTPPQRLVKAVEGAGGEVRRYDAPKPWEMPKWVRERAREEGLMLDAEAAKALVAAVGTRQQRLAREIERLALLAHPRTALSADQVERLAGEQVTRRAHELADAVVARDVPASLELAEELGRAGERPGRLTYAVVRRLREVHRAAELLDAGTSEKQVAGALRLPPWQAKRTVASARKADVAALERAICAFADLEVGLRGGAERLDLDEDTALVTTLVAATG
jgi:DNA polymerase-3 subunit delta